MARISQELLDATTETNGLFKVMSLAPLTSQALKPFGEAILARLQLDPLERELVVLHTVRLQNAEFQWVQHENIAPKLIGMPIEQVRAIAQGGDESPVFNERQKALLAFVRQAVVDVRVDDATYALAAEHFPARSLVEIVFIIGYYMLLARMSEIFQIPSESTDTGLASLVAILDRIKGETAADVKA